MLSAMILANTILLCFSAHVFVMPVFQSRPTSANTLSKTETLDKSSNAFDQAADPQYFPNPTEDLPRKTIHKKNHPKREHSPGKVSFRFPNRCYFKRCKPGQKCVLDGITKRATCVCRTHCKKLNKPVCGTDGSYYSSPCEMYQSSCISRTSVYAARNKDCFYKKTTCNEVDFFNFLDALLEYLHATLTMTSNADDVTVMSSNPGKVKSGKRYKRRAGRTHQKKQPSPPPVFDIDGYRSSLSEDLDDGGRDRNATTTTFFTTTIARSPDVAEEDHKLTDAVDVQPPSLHFRGDAHPESLIRNLERQVKDEEVTTATISIERLVQEKNMNAATSPNNQTTNDISNDVTFDDVNNKTISDDVIDENNENAIISPAAIDSTSENIFKKLELEAIDNNFWGDDIITNDVRGDLVKHLFKSMDLDMDGLVGSEEVYQVGVIQDIDVVLPFPCSLFHLLHNSDENEDGSMDIHELFKIYNITIVQLADDLKLIHQAAVYGEEFTLQCNIDGEPNPIWTRHGYSLTSQEENGIRVEGSKVSFSVAHPKLAGDFSCHTQIRPDIQQVIKLSVNTKPRVQVHPRSQQVVAGSGVTITCKVVGMPTPLIKWMKNGEDLDVDSGRYLIMENNTEVHINQALPSDGGAYSCVASNDAGLDENDGIVFVENGTLRTETAPKDLAAYFVFHRGGILMISSENCAILRRIDATDMVPGLLKQNKLCKSTKEGEPQCRWSSAVSVGSRFVYAAQPDENRLVVLDTRLHRLVEVIVTDAFPVSLHYAASSDQLFVLSWIDLSCGLSVLQVIYDASVPGVHSSAQIQPFAGSNDIDLSVFNFFLPPESSANEETKHGFVAHKDQPKIYKLDLSTLLYDDDVIDLQPYNCVPKHFAYRPIGGLLDVTCQGDSSRTLSVEYLSGQVVATGEETDYSKEHVSSDGKHVVRLFPERQLIRLLNVTDYGELVAVVDFHSNFMLSDVTFVGRFSGSDSAAVYLSSQIIGDIMYLDASNGAVDVLDGLSDPVDPSNVPWTSRSRMLAASTWYDRHIAVAGASQLEIIDVTTNDVSCRLNDVNDINVIVWSEGRK
ncbi:unnamed protein product [Clavelina lepadiformis]|uniref:Follistatin-related protein 5 n=1 Tax=Clavelina lepadiformis TaxID=159417 RepID=A0ABP0FMP8_CLALP